jgi:hypothetical protein
MDKDFEEALGYIMFRTRHENETLAEFAHRKFRQKRIEKKLKKNRIVVPTTNGVS